MRKMEFSTDLYDLEVYDDGTIFNKTLGKNQEMYEINTGHLFINVKLNGEFKNILVHRLIYSLFNGDIEMGYIIHHIDGNKLNNSLVNLQKMKSIDHSILHNKKYFDKYMICPICGNSFLWSAKSQSNFYRHKSYIHKNHKYPLNEPVCSKKCQGIYGSNMQMSSEHKCRNSKKSNDKLICENLDTGKTILFDNRVEAINYLLSNGIGTTRDSIDSSIRKCIRGKYKTAFGFKWSLV